MERTDSDSSFEGFFKKATRVDNGPYPYQVRLAQEGTLPALLDIPTGLGKTAGVMLAWLWRRKFASQEVRRKTPRRLVWCLPMRVLVEQTRENAILWLRHLGELGGHVTIEETEGTERVREYVPSWTEPEKIVVTVLMGGEDRDDWDLYPERDAIIIGTQDMLLSRALNRGYAMSRYRWPMHFGHLNNDCLWVMDEVQLMGAGLATSIQLQAFRQLMGTFGQVQTLWMSATMDEAALRTVDSERAHIPSARVTIGAEDRKREEVMHRVEAPKPVVRAESRIDDIPGLADEILKSHSGGSRTLAILNTVTRAQELYRALEGRAPKARIVLLHSRFRPPDRKVLLKAALEEPGPEGTVLVSTQVVEAGVDFSSRTLFTELAPWTSLVQRFGRCNRAAKDKGAKIYWLDLPEEATKRARTIPPYEVDDMLSSKDILTRTADGAPAHLHPATIPQSDSEVIRSKDLVELFDTTPDLSGNDTDVSRFIRTSDGSDVLLFWRTLPQEGPSPTEPEGRKEEMCNAPIGEVRELVKKGLVAYSWDSLESEWSRIGLGTALYPGMTLLLPADQGFYSPTVGWDVQSRRAVIPVPIVVESMANSTGYSGDRLSESAWMSVAEHTNEVVERIGAITDGVDGLDKWRQEIEKAARWHDSGKAHPSFQALIKPEMRASAGGMIVAKAPKDAWRHDPLPVHPTTHDPRRRLFRHELVSGLLALEHEHSDLVAYLAASHHGKVRLSIRSMPTENHPPNPGQRHARGVWNEDEIPSVELGGSVTVRSTRLDLSLMDLGTGAKGPSWAARMLSLRDDASLGPFRLTYLETLLRAADARASGALS